MTNIPVQQQTDQQLLLQFRSQGSRACLGELYKRYRHIMLGIAVKYLNDPVAAKDVVLDIFERLLRKRESILPDVVNVRAWLCIVTRNLCMDRLRQKQSLEKNKPGMIRFLYPENVEIDPVERRINSDLILQREDNLNAALKKLKEEHRRCIQMFYFSDMTYKEIADDTGLSLKQVKSYLQNGKLNLKRILENS